jgi:hypothetical protein
MRKPTSDERLGMTWWNGLTPVERENVILGAEALLCRDVSAADCWTLWKVGKVRMDGRAVA